MDAINLPLLAGDGIGFFFVIVVIGVVIAAIAYSSHRAKVVRQNWMMFAQRHRLNQGGSPSSPMIQGWYGNTYITLNTQVRGSGKNRTTYTQHHAAINAPMPAGLELYKEGFFSALGKIVGTQDIQVGDSAVDGAFIIKGNDVSGIKSLLTLPEVKKALLYAVARQPGLRVSQQNILVEVTGMTGDIPALEARFNDIAYLAQALDAGYQELLARSGGKQVVSNQARTNAPRPVSTPAARPVGTSPARAAEILAPTPQVRVAGPAEDPAQRAAVFSQMASVLHQYEDKLAAGTVKPQPPKVDMDHAFDDPHLDDDMGAAPALDNFDAREAVANLGSTDSAFDAPDAGDAFDNPTPFDAAPKPAPTKATAAAPGGTNLRETLEALSQSSFMTGNRDELTQQVMGRTFEVALVVDRVDRTFGFDIPDELRDGRTIEAVLEGSTAKLEVRFPKARNAEIDALRGGAKFKARGVVVAWDDLFKKAKLDAS